MRCRCSGPLLSMMPNFMIWPSWSHGQQGCMWLSLMLINCRPHPQIPTPVLWADDSLRVCRVGAAPPALQENGWRSTYVLRLPHASGTWVSTHLTGKETKAQEGKQLGQRNTAHLGPQPRPIRCQALIACHMDGGPEEAPRVRTCNTGACRRGYFISWRP